MREYYDTTHLLLAFINRIYIVQTNFVPMRFLSSTTSYVIHMFSISVAKRRDNVSRWLGFDACHKSIIRVCIVQCNCLPLISHHHHHNNTVHRYSAESTMRMMLEASFIRNGTTKYTRIQLSRRNAGLFKNRNGARERERKKNNHMK